MSVLLESKGGKQVEFQPKQVDYMMKHGWKKVAQSKPKTKPKTKPQEADK